MSFIYQGRPCWGRKDMDGIHVLGEAAHAPADLKAAIAMDALGTGGAGAPIVPPDAVTLLPVIPNPGKIICIGLNYDSHRKETGRAEADRPAIFTRFADTLVGDGDAIVCPRVSEQLDFEGELALVIGSGGRNIAAADAMGHLAGVTCFNDASVRDWQWHTSQFTPGKNFPSTGPLGPELVTLDEIGDFDSLSIETRLNGTVVQHATVADMIFSVPTIIAYVSSFTCLSPGDVIATGTPGGVGAKRSPPLWMRPGDEVVVEIGGVGRLRNMIVAEA